MSRYLSLVAPSALLLLAACGSATAPRQTTPPPSTENPPVTHTTERIPPPESGPARDVRFPPIVRASTSSGLELNSVESHALPILYVRLVIKSGDSADPRDLPGTAHLVAAMLKEGTRSRTSAALAEEVEFLGADVDVSSDEDAIHLSFRCLSDQLDKALEILADLARNPTFPDAELTKLKKRELDRLALASNDPGFLGAREFFRAAYGEHPYSHIDTNAAVLRRVRRADLAAWHRTHFVPNNAFLVAVGDITPAEVQAASERAFQGWRAGNVPALTYPTPPTRTSPEIIVVHRPDSAQSVIAVGNIALARRSPDYVKLLVANQVLGGSAASRLFMDLRERRSLTYGAYSSISDSTDLGTFRARASVRNEVTAEAMSGFMEHIQRITREGVPEEELRAAQRNLSDSFPLRIDTPGKIAGLVADLRLFGLPDDYWDSFRSQIGAVTPAQALEAARTYIRPNEALIVVVGESTAVVEPLRAYGDVTVMDTEGRVTERLPRAAAPATPAASTP